MSQKGLGKDLQLSSHFSDGPPPCPPAWAHGRAQSWSPVPARVLSCCRRSGEPGLWDGHSGPAVPRGLAPSPAGIGSLLPHCSPSCPSLLRPPWLPSVHAQPGLCRTAASGHRHRLWRVTDTRALHVRLGSRAFPQPAPLQILCLWLAAPSFQGLGDLGIAAHPPPASGGKRGSRTCRDLPRWGWVRPHRRARLWAEALPLTTSRTKARSAL